MDSFEETSFPALEPFFSQIEDELNRLHLSEQDRNINVAKIWTRMELEAGSFLEGISLNNGRYILRPKLLDNPTRH